MSAGRQMSPEHASISRARSARAAQLVQERPGIPEVGCIESFRELVVGLPEKVVCFAATVLIPPQAGKVCRGAELEGEGSLAVGGFDRLQQPLFRLGARWIASGGEACPCQAMRFR